MFFLFISARRSSFVHHFTGNRALVIFLRSKYGYLQLERRITGSTGQLHLYPKDIGTVLVPILEEGIQNQLTKAFRASLDLLKQSKSFYLQAEQFVLKEIGWDKLRLSQPRYWSVRVSQAREVHRVDAEHFQPKYDKLLEQLKKTSKVKRIADILDEPIQKGVTPDYEPNGSIVVVNSQHLGRYNLNYEATDRTTEAFWKANNRSQIRQNDVMIYATGAYIGRTNTYVEKARALAGVDVLLVRPTKEINPLYLSVFLNSSPGLMQSKKFSSGSGQAHIYPDGVRSYWIYAPPETFQQKIADLVKESYTTRQKAKALLEKAKEKVEAVILGNWQE